MKLVAGLGNPGSSYERTPHSVGFDVVDLLCCRLNGSWRDSARFEGRVAKAADPDGGEVLLLVKPQTFMNASGRCVGALMRYHRMEPADVLVVLDDVELPPGRIRIREGGGDGGHRGLASVTEHLGTTAFPRMRVGVGRGSGRAEGLVGYVLGRFPPEVRAVIDDVLPVAAEAVRDATRHGVPHAMNKYNGFCVEATRPAADPSLSGGSARAPKEQG